MPVDNNQVFTMDLPGIAVSEEAVLYYEFRAQFLNGDGIAGTISSPHTGVEIGQSFSYSGTDLIVQDIA
jgi:hypothetical protein